MRYGTEEIVRKESYAPQIGDVAEAKVFDRCIGEANTIREQVMEASRIAYDVFARLAGPQPESDCAENVKEPPTGGALGDLQRIQSGTVHSLADLRRTLAEIGRLV